MLLVPAQNLACPIDGLALRREEPRLRCAAGHDFDLAKEGYCNLLLAQNKASLDPGDSQKMVAARRRILAAGHYALLAERVAALALEYAGAAERQPGCEEYTIVDAGCGEGYYPQVLAQTAEARDCSGTLALAGIDVSKWAIRAAARRKTPVTWLVANNAHPPFLPESVDCILCLFGFPIWQGFRGVLKAGGRVLLADSGPEHLVELRRIIYPEVKRTAAQSLAAAESAGFRQLHEEVLRFPLLLSGQPIIQDLLAMTPHAYRLQQKGREALACLDKLELTAEVVLRVVGV